MEFVHLILQVRCWAVHIPYVSMIKLKCIAQFSQWITLPTQLCPVLYALSANLLHSLIMWLIVSCQSPHNLLFCCVLSILALIWSVLMALFSTANWRDLVSLLRFTLLSHVHVFSCEMSLVSRLKHPNIFLPFLFSAYFRSVGSRVISVVSRGFDQSSSSIFYIVFESLNRCVNTVFNANKSFSSFFSWHI